MEAPSTGRAKDAIRITAVNSCRHQVVLMVAMTAGMAWDRTLDKGLFIDLVMVIFRHVISMAGAGLEGIKGMGVSKIFNNRLT